MLRKTIAATCAAVLALAAAAGGAIWEQGPRKAWSDPGARETRAVEAVKAPTVRRTPTGAIEAPWGFVFYINKKETTDSLFTFVDQPGNATWSVATNSVWAVTSGKTKDVDMWIFTPKIHLDPGQEQDFYWQMRTRIKGGQERVEIKCGDAATPEAMTESIGEPIDVTERSKVAAVTKRICYDEGRDIVVGLHVITPKEYIGGGLELWNVGFADLQPETPLVKCEEADSGFRLYWKQPQLTWPNLGSDPEHFTYRVVRGNIWTGECDTLTTTWADTAYVDVTDTLTPPRKFKYKVNSYYNGRPDPAIGILSGNNAGSDGKEHGGGHFEPPFKAWYHSWDCSIDMLAGKIIDANGDGNAFVKYTGPYVAPETGSKFQQLTLTGEQKRDDWFISPALRVEAGKTYVVRTAFGSNSSTETVGVFGGYAADTAALTDTVIPFSTTNKQSETFQGMFTARRDGLYRLGFHALTSGPTGAKLFFQGYEVGAGAIAGTPDFVTDLVTEADPEGTTAVTVSFKAPTTDIFGKALTALEKIELTRDGETVHTWASPQPGEALSCTDTAAVLGYHDWEVVPYTDKGAGRASGFRLFAGVNRAPKPGMLTAEAVDPTHVKCAWAPVGADIDGRAVKEGLLKYNVYIYNSAGYVPLALGVADTCGTFEVGKPGETAYGRFAVTTQTMGGESAKTVTADNLQFGPALRMPWGESFREGVYETLTGHEELDVEKTTVRFRTYTPGVASDFDSGSAWFGCTMDYDGRQGFSTPLIHIDGPEPRARMYLERNSDSRNYCEIAVDDGTGYKRLGTLVQKDLTATWEPLDVSLEEYVGKDVHVRFCIYNDHYLTTGFDNLAVYNKASGNLGIQSVTAQWDELTGGNANDISVRVRNYADGNTGSGVQDMGKCELLRDGVVVGSKRVPAIVSFRAADVEFRDVLPTGGATATYTARLTKADGCGTDNERTATFAVVESNRPRPAGLDGSQEHGVVTLTWTAAEAAAKGDRRTDTFEDYTSWTYGEIGGVWKTVDRDGRPNFGLYGVEMPIAGKVTSWFVMDQTLAGWIDPGADCYIPWQGDKCLASRYTYGETNYTADDWAISPRLSGEAQTVKLVCNGSPRYINFYASSTGDEVEDFELLDNPLAKVETWLSNTMNKICLELPEGTRYFAVRNSCIDNPLGAVCDMAMVDAVRLTPAAEEGGVLGYNVYCDGAKVNDAPVAETTYAHSPGAGSHTYYIKAVTKGGEGEPGNAYGVEVSGLEGPEASAGAAETGRYDALGREVGPTYRGVVVVKYSDGTARRVYNVK